MLRAPIALAVALLALLLSGAVIGAVGEAERTPAATDTLPEGYDSTTVAELSQELPRGEGSIAVALFTADSGTLDRATRGELTQLYADLVARSTEAGGQTDAQPDAGGQDPRGPGAGADSPLRPAMKPSPKSHSCLAA